MIEFLMPSLGADMEDGTLVEWRKNEGDSVTRGDIIADVDTQKGLIEIEIFEEGVIEKFLVEEGRKVSVGTPLALIRPVGESLSEKDQTHPILEKQTLPKEEFPAEHHRVRISPLARRIAEENKLNLESVKGTGEGGAITREDVENYILTLQTAKAEKTQTKPEEATTTIIGDQQSEAIRMAVAAAMSKSNREIPHYYLEKTIVMDAAMNWLRITNASRPVNTRLLPAALLIKAVAKSIEAVPELNAVWEEGLKLKSGINVGFVVSLRKGGIMVPAILDTNLKSIDEIMTSLNDLIPRARALKLRSSELSESTITVTSIGEGSADKVFGVIYPPQVAIIGFGRIHEQAVAQSGMMGIKQIIHVTLAGDHRATDGLTGSRFLGTLDQFLQNPDKL
jgi:pyruvate dehydrogenase E2 component (dihydrolipoamide acetyltransferase)